MKILKFLSATVIVIVITTFLNVSSVGASWSSGLGHVNINEINTPKECPDQRRSVVIVGQFTATDVCMQTTEGVRLGVYYAGNRLVSAISFTNDNKVYSLNLSCDGYRGCLYSSVHDTLIRKVKIPGTILQKLEIYRNVSERLTRVYPGLGFAASYNFDTSNPDYVSESGTGSVVAVGGIAISSNGEWLGVEFREKGFGVMSLEDFSTKRITTDFFYYNTGYRPSTEMAISNSGRSIIVTGLNAGFSLYDNADDCGYFASLDDIIRRTTMTAKCKSKVYLLNYADGFSVGIRPVFSPIGEVFSTILRDRSAKYFSVLAHPKGAETINQIDYLALGDSFTSGEGEDGDNWYLGGTSEGLENCHLSARSYPFLISSLGESRSIACSGAKIIDILGGDSYLGQAGRLADASDVDILQHEALNNFIPGRIPQIEFISRYQPRAVTVGIGGNDVGFMQKLSACITPGTCHWARDVEAKTQTAIEIQSLFPKLVNLYNEIQRVSPNTKIYAVGYPKIVDTSWICPDVIGNLITTVEAVFIENGIKYLNSVIAAAARQAGAHYVDIEDIYGDHRLCGFHPTRAIESFRFGDDIGIGRLKFIGNESFHPTPFGHQLAADRIDSILSDTAHRHCLVLEPATCGVDTSPPELPDYWGMTLAVDGNYYYEDMVPERVKRLEETPVALRTYSVTPAASLRASIFSEEQYLGEIQSNADGSVDGSIMLPEDFPAGFHTLVISGLSYTGEPVSYYQVVYVETGLSAEEETTEYSQRFVWEPILDVDDKDISAKALALNSPTGSSGVQVEKNIKNFDSEIASVLGGVDEISSNAISAEKITQNNFPDHIYFIVAGGLMLLSLYFFFTNNKT